jgi:hypothetical protein
MTGACKKHDTSVDSQSYFDTTEKQKSLKTRADTCNAIPDHKFNVDKEQCESLSLIDESKEACVNKRFYVWDDTKNSCVLDQRSLDEYNNKRCANMKKVFREGECVDP